MSGRLHYISLHYNSFHFGRTWPEQRRVEDIGPVRRHDHLDLADRVEAVELVEKLHERALDLAVGRRALREARAADRVDLRPSARGVAGGAAASRAARAVRPGRAGNEHKTGARGAACV